MSLYDDEDIGLSADKKADNVAGWASGIKFTQVQIKKPLPPQPKREVRRQQLAPVVAFNVKGKGNSSFGGGDVGEEGEKGPKFILPYSVTLPKTKQQHRGGGGGGIKSFSCQYVAVDPEWQFENEYDPYFPNEYDKALKDLRERRDREAEEEEAKRREGLLTEGGDDREEEEGGGETNNKEKMGGVQIAPPPSLNIIDYDDDQPFSMESSTSGGGSNVEVNKSSRKGFGLGIGPGSGATAAAKIMAKYGYKEGQGLGRMEQGMSTALKVEKTSHRIGRIIHESDIPKEGVVSLLGTPPNLAASYMDDDEFEMEVPQPQTEAPASVDSNVLSKSQEEEAEQQLKNPSKVVLLSNMVGPNDVDDDLEPEVKGECQKYGEVIAVIVFKMPDVDSDDSIRIFVEFAQVTSAVKAFMDLNGRFFGGRQLKATFYDPEKFNNLELTC